MIRGNFIGINAAGTAAAKSAYDGFFINNGSGNNIVGGTTPAARNVISGNDNGVLIDGTSGNVVEGNLIGTNAAGTAALANQGDGVLVDDGAKNNFIGGTAAGAANTIAYNNGYGVEDRDSTTAGTTVRGNAIFGNADADQVDIAGGANNSQASPIITSATLGAATTASGTLASAANTTYVLDFYGYNSSAPLGETYLGSANVTTNASGNATWNATLGASSSGQWIVATATDPSGDTSADSFYMLMGYVAGSGTAHNFSLNEKFFDRQLRTVRQRAAGADAIGRQHRRHRHFRRRRGR